MSLNEKKDAIQAHAEGLIKRGKDKLDQYIRIGPPKKVSVKLQKNIDIRTPMMPSLRFVFGTEGEIDTQALKINYKPNWKCAITETWFHGQIQINTNKDEVKYEKIFDLDSIHLKVHAMYDWGHKMPHYGFKVATSSGITAPANANGFSICKNIEKRVGPMDVKAEIESSLDMGESMYSEEAGKYVMAPAHLDINACKLMFTL